MNELNLTYEEVGKRGSLPKPTVYALATKHTHLQTPRMKTLEALARGLALPIDVIRQAAVSSAGYLPTEDIDTQHQDVAAVIDAMNKMTFEQRTTVRQIVTAMIR